MKATSVNIALTLIALLVSLVAAEGTLPDIFVLTLINVKEPLKESEITAIDTAMDEFKTELDNVVKEVVVDTTVPSTRNLRVGGHRNLPCTNRCDHYASIYVLCYVNGIWMERCRRELTMHEDLSEEEVAALNEDDRRRHLQVSTLCHEAKTGIASAIGEAKSEGLIPIPPGSTITEKCFYEYP